MNVITSNPNGNHDISFDRGITRNGITGLPAGQWFSPIIQDPIIATKIYAGGRNELYKSDDLLSGGAYSWTMLGTPAGTGNILHFAIAPSSSNIIYAIKEDAISISIDSGLTFTDITSTLPVSTSQLSNLAVSNTDPNNVWVTFSGYAAADKVYKTTNGGTSWTNISTALPNLPINTIVFENGSTTNAIYIGADIGVFYLNDTLPSWITFNNQLPNNAVTDLEIYYPTNMIRASTYGRGTWESELFSVVIPNGITTIQNNVLSIYPNPTNNSTTISLTKAVTNATIKLINNIGETVLEKQNQSGNKFNIDMARQAHGIYFIEVQQDENVWKGKVVKE
jgi:Secretion system C-terminal sorting domain